MQENPDIRSMSWEELNNLINSFGEPKYRAKQVFGWLHAKGVSSNSEMTNIPGSLREKLPEPVTLEQADIRQSADGTRKYLFKLRDGYYIESVLMRYKYGNTVCISSQAGCRMGCRFCASTLDGLSRNLAASEMLDQIYRITHDINERISHIVVMGCGEPMDNFDNLIRFLSLITDPRGYGLSRRNITVSTCGLADRIRDFADLNTGVTLAVSLHAPFDELRRTIMPITDRFSVAEVCDAAQYYFERTGRRVTFEYALADGVNDSDECASGLARIAGRLSAHVNLIPVNPVTERGYKPTSQTEVSAFKNKLEKQGINVTIRRELGQDIDGACGQLRKRRMEEESD